MNWKKFFFAFIGAFIFLFVFGFLWYGTLMHGAHREVPTLLRPEADLKSYFGWLALGQFVMAHRERAEFERDEKHIGARAGLGEA